MIGTVSPVAALRLVVKGIRVPIKWFHSLLSLFPHTDPNLLLFAMNEDHRTNPPLDASESPRSREATPGVSSVRALIGSLSTSATNIIVASNAFFIQSQPRSKFCQALQKFKKNKTFKRSRHQTPAVQNADPEGASLNQNIEDVSRLQHNKLATSENPGDCVKQGVSGESAFKVLDAPASVEEIPDPQLGMQRVKLLGKRATSAASAAKDAPEDLDAADNIQTTYLQPLRILDAVVGNLVNVHPYAKVVLGMLSAASKVRRVSHSCSTIGILAQTERDKSVQSLEKLKQVYHFMSQDDTLGQISSKRSIAGRIAQQTLGCARFIGDYSEKGFCDELGDKLDLSGMSYAAGAGRDTTKQCLLGTRTDILSQITEWINDSRDTAQCVLWLSGPAGKGKSAIAHTIANWFKRLRRAWFVFLL
ncbi:hypothetical protein BDR07DRAFT_1485851 [Suillus spraguei]|nr:hypothetical protein BDR07DRAFT_1485851 [Suillus spraguei]